MTIPSTYSTVGHAEKILARIGEKVYSRVVSITDVKTQWATIERKMHRKPMTLTYKGEPKAVLISTADYHEILQMLIERQEDAEDLAAIAQHNPEESVPFETVVENLKRDGRL